MTRLLLMAGLAAAGELISLHLAAFQLHVTSAVWEPFFDDRARTALTAGPLRVLPIPDALLGAGAYALDLVLTIALLAGRVAERPLVAILVVAASAGGLVGLGLALAQPILGIGPCTLCFASSAISIGLAVLAVGEARTRLGRPTHSKEVPT